jgi:small subunit ribosomal protein S16
LLKIRLSRTGKKAQPSFRIVVAEHSNAVKRKYLEVLGHYVPSSNPKHVDFKKDRIEHWISKGAKPSDTMASLLKKHGFADMDKYIVKRTKTTRKKKGGDEAPQEAPKTAEAAS